MDILAKLKEYLDEVRAPLPPISDPDEPLHLDSLAVIRLVAFLENDIGIQLEDNEIHVDNFGTTRALERLIASKSPAIEA